MDLVYQSPDPETCHLITKLRRHYITSSILVCVYFNSRSHISWETHRVCSKFLLHTLWEKFLSQSQASLNTGFAPFVEFSIRWHDLCIDGTTAHSWDSVDLYSWSKAHFNAHSKPAFLHMSSMKCQCLWTTAFFPHSSILIFHHFYMRRLRSTGYGMVSMNKVLRMFACRSFITLSSGSLVLVCPSSYINIILLSSYCWPSYSTRARRRLYLDL